MRHYTTLCAFTRHARLLGTGAFALMLLVSACQRGDDKPVMTAADSTEVDSTATPVQVDEESHVDIGRWYDMTRADFDRQFTTFTQVEPPVVRDYGICDSITCHFPSSAPDAKAEILVCDLNGVYVITDAFRLLGIEIGQVGSTDGPWVSVASLDKRFSELRYKNIGKTADHTTQILLQFRREKTDK
ncbi:MAG: hypothetical protein IH600_01965 [Bacteroidetes bacterium]|nr:hypothetical protein [Bacteroidota bacterium]